ncbi:MAG TPA: class I SAM-dependent methyltransferase, partial [Chitinophagaceae bacterium]|nr:class I SAM-dependent methyltransferase [Chitinophagaceae bacterium]
KRNIVGWHYIYRLRKSECKDDPFVHFYLTLRDKENRIYSDQQLTKLPSIDPSHPHASEWVIRERSATELFVYLRLLDKGLDILEIGCGNGWLSNKLATIPRSNVTGIDVNGVELEQAKRVFGDSNNLRFLHGDIRNGLLENELFDIIVFAASIQYFENLQEILLCAIHHLNSRGCIHIIDSCFYNAGEVNNARKRSKSYFNKIGFPEMTAYYFHHSINDLKNFNYRIVYDSRANFPQTQKRDRLFPWICIEENQ